MNTQSPPPAARFQLRIQDFYVLAALNFVGTAILLYFEPAPHPLAIIAIWLGILLWWLAVLAFRPGKLGEGVERLTQLVVRLSIVLFILSFALGGVAAIVLPNCFRSRMASNESAAIGCCKTFASAEDTFRRVDYDHNGVLEYATNLQELYGNGKINLIDKNFAGAEWGAYAKPKAGYYFKVLKSQGPGGPGGQRSYFDANGHMKVGYELLAFPAEYGESGIWSMQISSSGTLYFKNLGPDTTRIAATIHAFDLANGWMTVE